MFCYQGTSAYVFSLIFRRLFDGWLFDVLQVEKCLLGVFTPLMMPPRDHSYTCWLVDAQMSHLRESSTLLSQPSLAQSQFIHYCICRVRARAIATLAQCTYSSEPRLKQTMQDMMTPGGATRPAVTRIVPTPDIVRVLPLSGGNSCICITSDYLTFIGFWDFCKIL